MTRTGSKPRTKRELIIGAWDEMGRPGVGEEQLQKFQSAICESFGAGAVESPATIARLLADEGAELRHPEVIEFDARWRQAQIKTNPKRFRGLKVEPVVKPLRLRQAENFIKRLERLRERSERSGDKADWQRARDQAIKTREIAESRARDRTLDQVIRTEQAEIAEWLGVWLQTPKLFAEWLELRRRSGEFRERFGDADFGVRQQT
jgi:hypothetical protein